MIDFLIKVVKLFKDLTLKLSIVLVIIFFLLLYIKQDSKENKDNFSMLIFAGAIFIFTLHFMLKQLLYYLLEKRFKKFIIRDKTIEDDFKNKIFDFEVLDFSDFFVKGNFINRYIELYSFKKSGKKNFYYLSLNEEQRLYSKTFVLLVVENIKRQVKNIKALQVLGTSYIVYTGIENNSDTTSMPELLKGLIDFMLKNRLMIAVNRYWFLGAKKNTIFIEDQRLTEINYEVEKLNINESLLEYFRDFNIRLVSITPIAYFIVFNGKDSEELLIDLANEQRLLELINKIDSL